MPSTSGPCREHIPAVPSNATTLGRWVDAGDLRVGDELLLRDGRIMPVQTVWTRPYEGDVYNVEVEDLHCYAVGNNGALVHNSNNGEGGAGGKASPSDLDGPGTFDGVHGRRLAGSRRSEVRDDRGECEPTSCCSKGKCPSKSTRYAWNCPSDGGSSERLSGGSNICQRWARWGTSASQD